MRIRIGLILLALTLVSWNHKFYVGIYQIEHNEKKHRLQITCRVFADDLNKALNLKYKKQFSFGEKTPTIQQTALLNQYIGSKFSLVVNGTPQELEYMLQENENNVLILYYRIENLPDISTIEITNSIMTEFVTEQQNIIQTDIKGKKANLLLTSDKISGSLDF